MARYEGTRDGRARCSGFTLIELLVVVSTICLLMSLLLPSLTRAQRQGEQIHCLANQRQLLLAWLQYAADRDDKLCRPTSFDKDLESYVLLKQVFLCKSVDDWRAARSYAVSNAMAGEYRDGVKPYQLLHKVSFPSERMVFVDQEPGSLGCFWPLLLHEDKTWVWRPWSPGGGLQGTTGRHNNGCNMSFADGHGEFVLWRDDRTRNLIKGRLADEVAASSDNPDLQYLVRVLTHRDKQVTDAGGDDK